MKWAKVKDQIPDKKIPDKDLEQIRRNDAICFAEYPDSKTLESELRQKKNIWVEYSFPHSFPAPKVKNYENFKTRYEIFCGGFLYYYDAWVKTRRAKEHVIHFEWSDEKNTGQYWVRVYISPSPKRSKTDNKWTGKSSVEPDNNKISGIKSISPKGPPPSEENPDNFERGVDPPPPPPPPPPSMH